MHKTYRVMLYRLDGAEKYPTAYRLSRSCPLRTAKRIFGIKSWKDDGYRLQPGGGALLSNGKRGQGKRLFFAYHGFQMKSRMKNAQK